MSQTIRIGYLANYLRELGADVVAEGKVAKIKGNPVQEVAVALISGSLAIVESMASDIRILAGIAKDQAQSAQPMLERLASDALVRGGKALWNKLFRSK